jgi:hypothetical protein
MTHRGETMAHRRVAPAVLALLLGLGMLQLAACERKGPAERAGENVDQAGQKLHDAVDPPKGPAQSLGRSIDRATD